ncbi:MAG: hypothetical protein QOI45_2586 [Thermoleophilaceae bacterium]|jgi:hypothetical protein|nr:hypothetical protein [Thermoleophilaceae bacterium]MEA2456324.1 hypothetical protein [Thermoleophilaceae bacterium]
MDDGAGRDRLDALERERSEQVARANAAIAAAQDRSYWLDRWNVDLNSVMRRRGASELRAGVRALRAVYRLLPDGWRALKKAARRAPAKLASTRRGVTEDRERALRGALDGAGLGPRPGDAWLRVEGGTAAVRDQLDGVRDRLPAGARVVLEADGVTPAALLAQSTPAWRIALYLEGDPDVYVLELR